MSASIEYSAPRILEIGDLVELTATVPPGTDPNKPACDPDGISGTIGNASVPCPPGS